MKNKLIIQVLALLLLPVAASYGDDRELHVGVISGLGGIAAKWNRFQNMGIQFAQEELAQKGWRIKLTVEDSQTSGPRAISAFDKLIALDKVDVIVADDFGFAIAPLIPKVAKRKKLFVALSLPHDRYCKESNGYFFSITSQFSKSTPAFERFFDLHPEVRRIAIITFDDQEWGLTYRALWEGIAKRRGIAVVDNLVTNEFLPDYKTFFARILPKRADAILIAHEPETFFKVKEQFAYRGFVVTANNAMEMLTDSPVRKELEGAYIVDPAISSDFRSAFYKRFKRQPILEAYAGYEALRSVAQAFEADWVEPQKGMRTVKYHGVAGPIDFTTSSCTGNFATWGLYRFENGEMRQE